MLKEFVLTVTKIDEETYRAKARYKGQEYTAENIDELDALTICRYYVEFAHGEDNVKFTGPGAARYLELLKERRGYA